uniref:Galectin n=1 Tax=Haemonchus contortus TaxID=6289 RepID=A0A7I4Y959_HAECO|nr:Galectin domain containing protein [Haemonchus contortus]
MAEPTVEKSNEAHFRGDPKDAPIPPPFLTKLSHPPSPGHLMEIRGVVNKNASRVSVAIFYGKTTKLWVIFAYDSRSLAVTTEKGIHLAGAGEVELPFVRGHPFQLGLRFQEGSLEILASNKQVLQCEHPLPISEIEGIGIKGNCMLKSIHGAGRRWYPSPWYAFFPEGYVRFGQKFIIHGTPRGDVFSVDLIGSYNNVPFSFTPSFQKNQIVRNASRQGEWGPEETDGRFPFEKDQDFDLIIRYDPSDIKYFVNRKQVGSFAHRFDEPERVCTGMRILGDVEVHGVELAHLADSRIPVPLTVRLGQKLRPGENICIRGAVKNDASGFNVNFLRGDTRADPSQTVLLMDFRFDENAIVMNTSTDGAWGEAERVSLPLQKGDSFNVDVGVTVASMEISCNGNLIYEYKHRVSYDEITYIQINGDCTLTNVFGTGRKYFSVPWLTGFPDGNLKTGQRIFVHGVSKGNSWNLDLLDTSDDILFRFNPRFDNKQIVRNSSKAGQWANEESSGPFPFEIDQPFDLVIENEPSSLKIIVNGEEIGTFEHRTDDPMGDYSEMRLEGDIEVTKIDVK